MMRFPTTARVRHAAWLGPAGVLLQLAACATPPPVTADGLPLKKVVVFRNGIGYFERGGRVEADRVLFKVRPSEIGDFLATFAVIERGGSSVKSASFPLDVQDDDAPTPTPTPVAERGAHPAPPVVPGSAADHKLRTVVMGLDGREHDLQVGYVAETPIWRPSYRLVIEKDGALLQVWGIVQNLSGEDWTNVRMSLIAEAPLAFQASLAQAVIPRRPTVSDGGDVIAVVPRSETSLAEAEEMAAPPPPAAAPSMAAPGGGAMAPMDMESKPMAAKKSAPSRARGAMAREAAGPMAQGYDGNAAPSRARNLAALAAVAVQGGATRYDIPLPVTVPDKSATMVLLLDKKIPGEAIFLWAPDGGVPESTAHPFRVARFTNASGGLLERGPLAIFAEGSFVGQGMIDALPEDAKATVPFALERSLAVERDVQYIEEGARLAQIEAGTLIIERDHGPRSKYKVKNGGPKPAHLLVKHARVGGARLLKPPPGTEDNLGTGSALVPLDISAHGAAELVLEERSAARQQLDWMSPLADDAVRAYMSDRRADPVLVAGLRAAWDARGVLKKASDERSTLQREQADLSRTTDETRNNIKAIEKNLAAGDLRAKLTDRLGKASARLDLIVKRLVELDMQIGEMAVRFNEAIRALKLTSPLPAES